MPDVSELGVRREGRATCLFPLQLPKALKEAERFPVIAGEVFVLCEICQLLDGPQMPVCLQKPGKLEVKRQPPKMEHGSEQPVGVGSPGGGSPAPAR